MPINKYIHMYVSTYISIYISMYPTGTFGILIDRCWLGLCFRIIFQQMWLSKIIQPLSCKLFRINNYNKKENNCYINITIKQ